MGIWQRLQNRNAKREINWQLHHFQIRPVVPYVSGLIQAGRAPGVQFSQPAIAIVRLACRLKKLQKERYCHLFAGMKIVDYFYLLLFPLLLSGGQFFFKKAAASIATHSFSHFLMSAIGNRYLWAVLFVYGVATLLWLFILSRVPMNKALPFAALTFVIVPVGALVFFGEKPNLMYWVGVLLIVVGVYITAMTTASA